VHFFYFSPSFQAIRIECFMVYSRYLSSLLCLLMAGVLTACGAGNADDKPPYHHLVKTYPLVPASSYAVNRHFVAKVEARQRVVLGFELAGTVATVAVDEGELVEQGQLLARLDTQLLDVELQQSAAQLQEIKAKQKLAKLELQRQQTLKEKGFTAEQRIDELNAELDVLAAQLLSQQATVAATQARIDKSSLYAPYDGQVAVRYVDGGAVVAGQDVLQILERGDIEVRAGIPAELAAGLNVGDKLTVEKSMVEANTKGRADAEIIAIGHTVNDITRTVNIRLALPDEMTSVDGGLVYLSMDDLRQQAGFWIPATALSASVRGLWNVLVVVPVDENIADDATPVLSTLFRLEARSVHLLHMSGDRAFINGEFSAGESIVATGVHRLAVGQVVRVDAAVYDMSTKALVSQP
jgi:RND family efflux transporter MFP subunit